MIAFTITDAWLSSEDILPVGCNAVTVELDNVRGLVMNLKLRCRRLCKRSLHTV